VGGGHLQVMAFDRPDEQLNAPNDESNNPRSFHTEHETIILHLLWEALDYVDCPHSAAASQPFGTP
jgi:hypothetical protein